MRDADTLRLRPTGDNALSYLKQCLDNVLRFTVNLQLKGPFLGPLHKRDRRLSSCSHRIQIHLRLKGKREAETGERDEDGEDGEDGEEERTCWFSRIFLHL